MLNDEIFLMIWLVELY